MINIKQNTLSLIIFLSLFGCIDPNNDDLWSISIDATLETNGFAIIDQDKEIAIMQKEIEVLKLEIQELKESSKNPLG